MSLQRRGCYRISLLALVLFGCAEGQTAGYSDKLPEPFTPKTCKALYCVLVGQERLPSSRTQVVMSYDFLLANSRESAGSVGSQLNFRTVSGKLNSVVLSLSERNEPILAGWEAEAISRLLEELSGKRISKHQANILCFMPAFKFTGPYGPTKFYRAKGESDYTVLCTAIDGASGGIAFSMKFIKRWKSRFKDEIELFKLKD